MKKALTLLTAVILLFTACSKTPDVKPDTKFITKLVFTKADNPSLTADVEGIISGNEIKVVLHGVAKNNLKPTITYGGKTINSATDFTNPVKYTVTAEDGTTTTYTVTVENRDVYIAGYEWNSQTQKTDAVYWKNGNKIKLTNSNDLAFEKASAITVINNDVYVSGTSYNSNRSTAVYWKNGVKVSLTDQTVLNAKANAIFVSGTDVYVAGIEDYKAVYWKNGVKTEINNGQNGQAELNSIFVIGNDVHVAGSIYDTPSSASMINPYYWKNGNMIPLNLSNTFGQANKITVINNDMYVVYQFEGGASGYWKNGNMTNLNAGSGYGGKAYSIANIENDIYIVGEIRNGYSDPKAVCWKNGVMIALTNGINYSSTSDVFCKGSDVYITGFEIVNGVRNCLYWLNGKPTIVFSSDKELSSGLTSICVTSN